MNLYLRHGCDLQRVVDRVGVVGPCSRVYDQAIRVCCLVDPGHELPLVVGLADLELDVGEGVAQELLYVSQGLVAVYVGAARAQSTKVDAVEDEYPRQRRPPSPCGPPLRRL